MIRGNAFPSVLKLRKPTEFRTVYQRGMKKASRSFVVFMLPNGSTYSRFGLTTPRKLGKAHERNRIKRRVREIVRVQRAFMPVGFDVVVNPKRSAGERNFQDLQAELLSLLGGAL